MKLHYDAPQGCDMDVEVEPLAFSDYVPGPAVSVTVQGCHDTAGTVVVPLREARAIAEAILAAAATHDPA